ANRFFTGVIPAQASADETLVARQAIAGLMWGKQFYHFDVKQWLTGDQGSAPPPPGRRYGRNNAWWHMNSFDVISMPDPWEYPWYAAWDLAFHCVAMARADPHFAKEQLVLLTREWFMHPSGQLPAYEWALGDANPPVHAWAAWQVYEIDRARTGRADRAFLERVFHKLLLNFTWWVNRKDLGGRNVFQGGFLGLDNIGVFNRSEVEERGGQLDQADGTSWMAMYCLDLLRIALELARDNPVYQDVATKFFEHFLYIAGAMNDVGGQGVALWDPEDEFFYDVLRCPGGGARPLKVRSMVGVVPLFAVEVLDPARLACAAGFERRARWFLRYRPDLAALVS
ncbi:MAG TPA: glucosidase, partial [Vicinamibacteria bacterium]|nr:glucosidase [Vicinamibacteria bacterium]